MRQPERNKHDTRRTGQISEAVIMARFLQLGYVVLTPYGGNQRYDLVIEDADGQFWRIQCKTGWINEARTILQFSTANSNVTGKNRQLRHYRGQCNYFAVYNEVLNKVYLIAVDQVAIGVASLCLSSSENNRNKDKLCARDYEL
jgi:hypothetical protein